MFFRPFVKNRLKIEQEKEKMKFGKKVASQTERRTTVTPMEQIANLKLFHLPKALALGVDLFILDLDVGFINSPMHMIRQATETKPNIDIFVQVRLLYIHMFNVINIKLFLIICEVFLSISIYIYMYIYIYIYIE